MTLSKNANPFDSIEVEKALNEHADAWRAYARMTTRELRAAAEGNKWGCSEAVRLHNARTALLNLGHSQAEIDANESEVI
jgi:hypothetical protein